MDVFELQDIAYYAVVGILGAAGGLARGAFAHRRLTYRYYFSVSILSGFTAFGVVAFVVRPDVDGLHIDWPGLGVAALVGITGSEAYRWAHVIVRQVIKTLSDQLDERNGKR
jgi:hypothetical protein